MQLPYGSMSNGTHWPVATTRSIAEAENRACSVAHSVRRPCLSLLENPPNTTTRSDNCHFSNYRIKLIAPDRDRRPLCETHTHHQITFPTSITPARTTENQPSVSEQHTTTPSSTGSTGL